jgi:uracil-DNA glycosylase family 4
MGEGPKPCDVMIIGEAPGETEDKLGRPFVGKAGKRLDEALIAAGLKRDEVYITNIYKFRPPNNRKPTPEEIVEHLPSFAL